MSRIPALPKLPALPRVSLVDPLTRRWERLPWWGKALVLLGVLAFAIWYPSTLEPKWQSVLFFPVGVYILLALGLNVVVGLTGMLDLGYVAFFAVGAYTTAKLTAEGGGLTAWECILLAVLLAMVAGVTLGGPTLRLRGDYLAIVTLGFGEIVRIVAQNTPSLGQARGITAIPHPSSLAGLDFGIDPLPYVYLVLAAIVLAIFLIARLRRSRVGRSWAAIREDEDAAELMGVPTFKMKLWSFAVGASTGGLGGWIYASKVGFINPDTFPLNLSFLVLAAVVLGGLGSTPGVIAGAFAVGFIPEYLREFSGEETVLERLNSITGGEATDINEYRFFLFGLALILMMIFRPQGLLPSRQRAAELAEATGEQAMGAVAGVDEADVVAQHTGDRAATLEVPDDVDLPDDFIARAEEAQEEVLRLTDVTMQFGGVVALNDVSLTVRRGEIFGIIGPNGAGKTTVFNCITGVFRPTSGDIGLDGVSLVGKKPHHITEAGVARTFQNIRLFPNMTAIENILVGADARHTTSVPGAVVGSPKHGREERLGRAEALRLLDFVGIGRRVDEAARNLPYGDQRRLEIARAIATQPKVLLLDEPAAGFNPAEKQALVALIRQICRAGLTVVLIEHDMEVVMEVCHRIAVLDFGEKIAEGLPEEIQSDERVIRAYLGVEIDAP
ncbi:MAG: branched-chain amino acid ABC transporter ATP-binding protein/permease [Acidimicrobiales bacterium]|nr:branched-chain amino acid ABC transporter ATP-binding protein/permease [Acidimicrobiales bacterium]